MARSSAWKNTERELGKYFGVMRKIGSGSQGRSDHVRSDTHHPEIFMEAKNRKSYAAVVNELLKRRSQRKDNEVVTLVFRGDIETLAVHSKDLTKLLSPNYVWRQFSNPKLRVDFKDYTDAKGLAALESKPHTLLACKKPRMHGFCFISERDSLLAIAKWSLAGTMLVNKIASDNNKPEHCVEVDGVDTELLKDPHRVNDVVEMMGKLMQFTHHWQIPKERKKDSNVG